MTKTPERIDDWKETLEVIAGCNKTTKCPDHESQKGCEYPECDCAIPFRCGEGTN